MYSYVHWTPICGKRNKRRVFVTNKIDINDCQGVASLLCSDGNWTAYSSEQQALFAIAEMGLIPISIPVEINDDSITVKRIIEGQK